MQGKSPVQGTAQGGTQSTEASANEPRGSVVPRRTYFLKFAEALHSMLTTRDRRTGCSGRSWGSTLGPEQERTPAGLPCP